MLTRCAHVFAISVLFCVTLQGAEAARSMREDAKHVTYDASSSALGTDSTELGSFSWGKSKKAQKKDVCEEAVPFSSKREKAWVPGRKNVCKCKEGSVLSRGCDRLQGDRKFDPTHDDLRGKGCKCEWEITYLSDPRSDGSESSTSSEGDSDSWETDSDVSPAENTMDTSIEVPDLQTEDEDSSDPKHEHGTSFQVPGLQVQDGPVNGGPEWPALKDEHGSSTIPAVNQELSIQARCQAAVPNAVAREKAWLPGRMRPCKCSDGFVLSAECGSVAGERRFDPADSSLGGSGCKCEIETKKETSKSDRCATVVPGSIERDSSDRFFRRSEKKDICKCEQMDSLLTTRCGDLAGLRKFDPTEVGARTLGCSCEQDGSETSGYDNTDLWGDVVPPTPAEPYLGKCDEKVPGAIDRTMAKWTPRQKAVCKCPDGFSLHSSCGFPEGTRKFDPREVETWESCRCVEASPAPAPAPAPAPSEVPDLQDDSDDGDGEAHDDLPTYEEAVASKDDVAHCKYPLPKGFQLGDFVRIEKKVLDSYLFGISLLPIYKDVRVSGTYAQVICVQEDWWMHQTGENKDRVCLRTAKGGGKAVGCWLPKNLVPVERFGDFWISKKLKASMNASDAKGAA